MFTILGEACCCFFFCEKLHLKLHGDQATLFLLDLLVNLAVSPPLHWTIWLKPTFWGGIC